MIKQSNFPYPPILYAVAMLAFCTNTLLHNGWNVTRLVGMIIIVFSCAGWITARLQLGNAFSLKPKASFLVTTGLYAKLRHPVYVFSVTALMGLTIFFVSWILAIATVLLIALELFRRGKEEAILLAQFGKEYEAYKQSSWF